MIHSYKISPKFEIYLKSEKICLLVCVKLITLWAVWHLQFYKAELLTTIMINICYQFAVPKLQNWLFVFPSVCWAQNVMAKRNIPYIYKANNLLLV